MCKLSLFLILFIISSELSSQENKMAVYYYNKGLEALQNEDCFVADSLFNISLKLLPHQDTYFNKALARNCQDDYGGFCYFMKMAELMGDEEAKLIFESRCSNFKYEKYAKEQNWTFTEPEFPGGEMELFIFLAENVVFPVYARDRCIHGTVYVGFILNPYGIVSAVFIERGVHQVLDNEAIRVVKMLPQWKSARVNGIPVPCKYKLPIRFVLPQCPEYKIEFSPEYYLAFLKECAEYYPVVRLFYFSMGQ